MKQKSVVYVNFAQYDNTGRILDYLKKNFDITIQFSYDHLRLKNGRKTNFLRIYRKNKLIEEKKLLSLRAPSILLFPSLPLVALLMVGQTILYTIKLSQKYGIFDIFFTVNAFSGWIGILLKEMGVIKKTVFWTWDYFPVNYPDLRIRLARWVYWQFDRPCMRYSDRITFANKKLFTLRKKTGMIESNIKPIIIPIGTNVKKIKIPQRKKPIIGFLGMIKLPQGVDMLIDSLPELIKNIPNIHVEIVGSGPEEYRLKKKARRYKNYITFYGFKENQNEIEKIIRRWSIGIATYIPDESNESYWGDPSKIKVYLSQAVPVITTNVSHFAHEIKKAEAGNIVTYGDIQNFVKVIKSILKRKKTYQKNALALAQKYHYQKIYPKMFEV